MTVKRYDSHTNIDDFKSDWHESKDGPMVRFDDYAELQRQLTAYEATVTNLTTQVQRMAAEGAALKNVFGPGDAVLNFLTIALRHTTYDQIDLSDVTLAFQMSLPETPSTDAELAEIRAQGVDGFIAFLKQRAREFPQSIVADSLDVITNNAEQYAYSQQLRKEQGK